MATKAAAAKPYDPVKAMEGMFNGSVTRIAQVLRDPLNYGASTKTVLTEVAKRFHDALDDCEVQLLDAKWYLEYQLEQNKLRREAEARELGTAAKRKHDEIKEPSTQDETPTKKPKIEDEKKQIEAEAEAASVITAKPTEEAVTVKNDLKDQKDPKKAEPPKTKPTAETPVQDDFAKPTPQASPAVTNEDFNFESMFGDPNTTGADNDLGFDLGLDGSFNDDQDANALDSLIPELDDFTAQPIINPTTVANPDALPAFSNDFDLPEIGGSNAFDDFLNDDTLGGDLGTNVDMNDQAMLDMDFDDSMFN